jgi:polar amino acid transport system substrate-binding protein
MHSLRRALLLGASSLLLASAVSAQALATLDPPRAGGEPLASPLRVLVVGNAPFATGADGALDGISVEIWREVATELGIDFTLERADTIPEALSQINRGEADVAIGPISITAERARLVHFVQPYFESALGILAPATGVSFWERLRPFLSGAFLGGAAILFTVLLGVGVLLWWVEYRRNAMFARGPMRGWGTGLWLAIVTMTTVGYGDKVPVTPAGRTIASVWMLISMLTVSSLTAFLATALTVASLDRSTLDSADDLPGRKVAAVKGSTGAAFARRQGARIVPVASVGEAIDRVAAGEAEAVVHDRPMLQYELRERAEADLVVSRSTYEPQDYGFAVRTGDELAHRLDVTLLELVEGGRVARIVDDWLESS